MELRSRSTNATGKSPAITPRSEVRQLAASTPPSGVEARSISDPGVPGTAVAPGTQPQSSAAPGDMAKVLSCVSSLMDRLSAIEKNLNAPKANDNGDGSHPGDDTSSRHSSSQKSKARNECADVAAHDPDGSPPTTDSDSDGTNKRRLRKERRQRRAKRKAKKMQDKQDVAAATPNESKLSTDATIKLYRTMLRNVTVETVLDPKFPALQKAWARLRFQHPLPWSIASTVLAHGFQDRGAVVYQTCLDTNPAASEEELWALLEEKLYNPISIEVKRDAYENARMHHSEGVAEFADRVSELASCLPDTISTPALCSRFLAGLPPKLRAQAVVADRGNFNSLVVTTSRLAALSRDRVYAVDVEGSRDNPIGPHPGMQSKPGHEHLRCYRCWRYGHVSTHCRHPRAPKPMDAPLPSPASSRGLLSKNDRRGGRQY